MPDEAQQQICYDIPQCDMDNAVLHDRVVTRFRAALTEIYGDRLERAVLFGSRARGDYRADSDYDVAIFLRGYTSRFNELGPLADLTTDILVDTGAEIVALPFCAGDYRTDRSLMREIARDGLDLVMSQTAILKTSK